MTRKEKFLIAGNLSSEKARPIFKKTISKKIRSFLDNTIFQVIVISIGLLICKEMSILIWTKLN